MQFEQDNAELANIPEENPRFKRTLERLAHDLVPSYAEMPALYANDGQGDNAIAKVKIFTPWSNWTWYLSEYDPADRLGFGLCVGHCEELGYVSIEELESVNGPFGLKVERDLHWTPKPLRECRRDSAPLEQQKASRTT